MNSEEKPPDAPPSILDGRMRMRKPGERRGIDPADASTSPFGQLLPGPPPEPRAFTGAPVAPGPEVDDRGFFRRYGALLAGVLCLGANHALAMMDGKVFMELVLLGSIVLAFGVPVAFDRQCGEIVQRRGKADLKRTLLLVAALLAGIALFTYLWVFFYQVEGTEEFRKWLGGR